MNVTLIMLAFNGQASLGACIESLLPLNADSNLLIIDNGSHDRSLAIAQQAAAAHADVAVIANGANLGFSGGMNVGLRLALGQTSHPDYSAPPADVVVLINQDVEVRPGWLTQLIAPFTDQTVAAVGAALYAPDGQTLRHVGGEVLLPRLLTAHTGDGEIDRGQYSALRDVTYATGALLALRTSVLHNIGLFDERYFPAYWEEIDLCARIQRTGGRIVVNPQAHAIHQQGTSISDPLVRSRMANRGRLLFAFKTKDWNFWQTTFAPAERAWMQAHGGHDDMRALRRAYQDALANFASWCDARSEWTETPLEAAERERRFALLLELCQHCIAADHAALEP